MLFVQTKQQPTPNLAGNEEERVWGRQVERYRYQGLQKLTQKGQEGNKTKRTKTSKTLPEESVKKKLVLPPQTCNAEEAFSFYFHINRLGIIIVQSL